MKKNPKTSFVVVGSGGGGGTIAWLLAKAGHSVTLLEQGPDVADRYRNAHDGRPAPAGGDPDGFNSVMHDEYYFRVKRPDPKRRLRGDYNTFRVGGVDTAKAQPFVNGWTASVLGGGSVIWGTWAFRPLPVDFKLGTFYQNLGRLEELRSWGYSLIDWPVGYEQMEPFYRVAEALLAVSGDRAKLNASITASAWFKELAGNAKVGALFNGATVGEPYPCPPHPINPVGYYVEQAMNRAELGLAAAPLPVGIVSPGTSTYRTREILAQAAQAGPAQLEGADFWKKTPDQLWSERIRQACNMCGFCGEYLCWGGAREVPGQTLIPGEPKSGAHATVIQELRDMGQQPGSKVRVLCGARAYEITLNPKTKRANGVLYLDISDPDHPEAVSQPAETVIVSCGAVQSARLLHMCGEHGLGNEHDQLGRNACFHLFGMGAKVTLEERFRGLLHAEFGPTGNTTSFGPYFIKDKDGRWLKGGTLTSTAKKNPLENAVGAVAGGSFGDALGKSMKDYAISVELRLTADDLPMPRNRVDLDPTHVDEFGFPVARITREVGTHEWLMYQSVVPIFQQAFEKGKNGVTKATFSPHILDLIGDHQMGTCRMGDDPATSVVDSWCRLHGTKNVFVVDSSVMTTGFGLNPMVTVVANALRVGTFIADTLAKAGDPTK